MTLQELANLLTQFTNEHFAKKDVQPFFRHMHQLALKGMGVGTGGHRSISGERQALQLVREALLQRYPAEPWVILDVGANVGQFLTEALAVFVPREGARGAGERFFCLEPSAASFAALQERVAAMGNPGNIQMFRLALGEMQEERPLYANTPTSEIASLYPRRLDHFGIPMPPQGTVRVETLDHFAAERGIERIHFLKLDVEGHELACLKGAKGLLEGEKIEFIQFEMGGGNIDSRTFFQDFWYALPGYSIKRILRDGLYDIPAYGEDLELFMTQNYLACLKH